MVSGAEIYILGNTNMVTEGDGGKVIKPGIFTKPAVVTNGESPGEFDPNAGFNPYTPADCGAKAAQYPHLKARQRNQASSHQKVTQEKPQELPQQRSAGSVVSGSVVIEMDECHSCYIESLND